jgi:hypothetical protein
MLNAIMLRVIVLSVIMLSVIMLKVIMLNVVVQCVIGSFPGTNALAYSTQMPVAKKKSLVTLTPDLGESPVKEEKV